MTWQVAHCLLQPLFEGELKGVEAALSATSIAEFDEMFTWRANGYASREGYYGAASCGGHVEHVKTPLLFVQVRWESVRNHAGLQACLLVAWGGGWGAREAGFRTAEINFSTILLGKNQPAVR